jgi:hypothetical protein
MGAFLVDRGVVGLKDAYMSIPMDRADFDAALESARNTGIRMRRASCEEARHWVAAGIRWAHDNGMRLPEDWVKTASLIGGVGDWRSADVSAFVKGFVGHPEDLRQRLIIEPFDSYIQRPDISFIFDSRAPIKDQQTGEYYPDRSIEDLSDEDLEDIADDLPSEEVEAISAAMAAAVNGLAAETASWLETQGDQPSPELQEAYKAMLIARVLAYSASPDAPDDEAIALTQEILSTLFEKVEVSRAKEFHRAAEQALRHIKMEPRLVQKVIRRRGLSPEQLESDDSQTFAS